MEVCLEWVVHQQDIQLLQPAATVVMSSSIVEEEGIKASRVVEVTEMGVVDTEAVVAMEGLVDREEVMAVEVVQGLGVVVVGGLVEEEGQAEV